MIQASLFPQLQEPFPRLDISLLYKIRYVHIKTALVLNASTYLENGKKIKGRAQYLYNSEWVYKDELPVERQNRSARESSLKFFMLKFKQSMKSVNKRWRIKGRKPLGVNEFEGDRKKPSDMKEILYCAVDYLEEIGFEEINDEIFCL